MALVAGALSRTAQAQTDVTVTQSVLGLTYKYSGVNCDTIVGEDIAYSDTLGGYVDEVPYDLIRVRGGILRSGSTPFDGLTVDQVKADPTVLNGAVVEGWFAKNFTTWIKHYAGTKVIVFPMLLWSRNAAASSPGCSRSKSSFNGQADQDLFWVASFAMAYWANVVNKYGLQYIEISNEPDNCNDGNGTNTPDVATHDKMMELAKDAFVWVNQKSGLVDPPLAANIVGPGVMSEYTPHVQSALASATTRAALDVVSWHAYWEFHLYEQLTGGAADVEQRAPGKRKWIDEWGATWYDDGYSNARLVGEMAPLMPVFNVFGVEAQAVWNLTGAYGSNVKFSLIDGGGNKSRFYWVTKLLNRALLSEKELLDTNLPNTQGYQKADDFFAWGTRDTKDLYVIVMNNKASAASVTVDVSAFAPAEGKPVSIYYVPATSPYGEKTLPAATVTSGKFKLDTEPGVQYVAVIAGGSDGIGQSDSGAGGSAGIGGSLGGAGGSANLDGGAAAKAGTGGIKAGAGGSAPDAPASEPSVFSEQEAGPVESPGCGCTQATRTSSARVSLMVLALASALRRRRAAGRPR
jgi:hypothetical protein